MWVYHFQYFLNVEIDEGEKFGHIYCFAPPIASLF